MSPDFLSVDQVLALHEKSTERFGGAAGVRDHSLVESGVAQPEAMFDGEWLHADIAQMAAAYLYSLVSNHPFVNGNKRTGVFAALQFRELNGYAVGPEHTLALKRRAMREAHAALKAFVYYDPKKGAGFERTSRALTAR